ncbi:Cytochrome c oxidase assembly protein cox15 [Talaromyces marneffei ATCC 18224]|uniref:Cytochrome c oxidase subunit 8, mitochondrial n=3 Tax=Talaromyces marneffei TaxID=37727 RepID=B6Q1K7_TALMQ|nr:cytochrome c subunit, putative [Talaromyces marneffei ATCC 18224]
MIAASATRARLANAFVTRRAFTTTRAQLASPYHYAEGPRSNIPFNPKTKYFFFRYWGFMIAGFGAPFAIAVWQTYKTRP